MADHQTGATYHHRSTKLARPGTLRHVRDGDDSLLEGLYESLITRALENRLVGLSNLDVQRGVIDEADEPDVLARHVRDVTLRALRRERHAGRRLALVNRLVAELGSPDDALP